MASGQSSSHPCHNLSNPSKRLFWCRHCMTRFADPIQRWRHSKTCKKIVSSNPRQEIVSTDGRKLQVVAGTTEDSVVVSNQATCEEPEPSVSKRKIRKLVMNDLKCQICDREFVSLDEMREHVKYACRKVVPFHEQVIPVTKSPLPKREESEEEKASALNSLEANLQQMEQSLAMRSDVADEVVANQIESLLKAAQVLQQQQQQQQQDVTYQILSDSLGDVDTQYVITTNPENFEENQFEAVTVETVATLENIVPQVAMCPEVSHHQVVQVVEPDDLQLISEVIAREEPEIGNHHSFVPPSCRTSSTSSSSSSSSETCTAAKRTDKCQEKQMNISKEKDDIDDSVFDCSSSDKLLNPEIDKVEILEKSNQLSSVNKNNDIHSDEQQEHEIKQKSPLKCEKCLRRAKKQQPIYDPRLDDFGFKNLLDSGENGSADSNHMCVSEPPTLDLSQEDIVCTCESSPSSQNITPKHSASNIPRKESKYKVHETAKKMATRSTVVSEKKTVSGKHVKKKRKYIGGKGSLDCVARSKRKKLKKTVTNNQRENSMCLQNNRKLELNQSHGSESPEANKIQELRSKAQGCDELDGESLYDTSTQLKTDVSYQPAKRLERKSRPMKDPKCRICDRVFKTLQLLQKHNKIPCKIKHTRNLCQKVLRPKRAPVEPQSAFKQKNKQNLNSKSKKNRPTIAARPQLLPVRRISDTTIFILPKTKKCKKRRKSAPVFEYVPPVKEYKNSFLQVHVTYESLPFREKFFFDLGMIATEHLSDKNKTVTTCEPFESLTDHSQCLQAETGNFHDLGPCTPPPVLEKIPVIEACSPSSYDTETFDLEPPVLIPYLGIHVNEALHTEQENILHSSTERSVSVSSQDGNANVVHNGVEETQPASDVVSQKDQVQSCPEDNELVLGTVNTKSSAPCQNKTSDSVEEHMSEIFSKYFNSPVKLSDNLVSREDNCIKNYLSDTAATEFSSPDNPQNSEPQLESFVTDLDLSSKNITSESLSSPLSLVQLQEQVVEKSSLENLECSEVIPEQKPQQTDEFNTFTTESQGDLPVELAVEKESFPCYNMEQETCEHTSSEEQIYPPSEHSVCLDNDREVTEVILSPSTEDLQGNVQGDNGEFSKQRTENVVIPICDINEETQIETGSKENPLKFDIRVNMECSNLESSPVKSATTRHFTDLLTDLYTNQTNEGDIIVNTSLWDNNAALHSVNNMSKNEDSSRSVSSAKTKDSQKLGDRHFMDAIFSETETCRKNLNNYNEKSALSKKARKVTVAVQTDGDYLSHENLSPSHTSVLNNTSMAPFSRNMVERESVDGSCSTKSIQIEISEQGETSVDKDTRTFDTCARQNEIENERLLDGISDSPIVNLTESSNGNTLHVEETGSKELSPKGTNQKGEGRNLFESLFPSINQDTECSGSQEKTGCFSDKNRYIEQSNTQEIIVYPPPQSELPFKALDTQAPECVVRSTSLPLGVSETPDKKQRKNILDLVAKSLGIYPEEEKNNTCIDEVNGTAMDAAAITSKDGQQENPSIFVNNSIVQSTSCSDETDEPSLQIIVMNNQSSSEDYTADINVIELPSIPEVHTIFPSSSRNFHVLEQEKTNVDNIQQGCDTSGCIPADTGAHDSSEGTPVKNQKNDVLSHSDSGVEVVMCGVEDLKTWDNSCIIVSGKSSVTTINDSNISAMNMGSALECTMSENQNSNLCNSSSLPYVNQSENFEKTENRKSSNYCDGDDLVDVVSQGSVLSSDLCNSATCSNTDDKTVDQSMSKTHCSLQSVTTETCPGHVTARKENGATTVVEEFHPVTTVADTDSTYIATDLYPSPMETNPNSFNIAPDESPVSMVTDDVSVCPGTWNDSKVMVQYVQDFSCSPNVSYIVLDNEGGESSGKFDHQIVISETPFLQTQQEEGILCPEEDNANILSDQPLQAVMN